MNAHTQALVGRSGDVEECSPAAAGVNRRRLQCQEDVALMWPSTHERLHQVSVAAGDVMFRLWTLDAFDLYLERRPDSRARIWTVLRNLILPDGRL